MPSHLSADTPDVQNHSRLGDSFFARRGAATGLAAVTLLMLLVVGMFYRQADIAASAKIWVVHTYEVAQHIQVLSNKLKDAELGQRGYMITGDERYLQPYHDAVSEDNDVDFAVDPLVQHHSISQEISELMTLTADNPVQQKNLANLDAGAKDLLSYWSSTIDLRRVKGAAALPKIDPLNGKRKMDNVRKIISSMLTEENRLLGLRTKADEDSTLRNDLVTYAGLGLFYLGLMLSVWLATRHWKRAQAAEAEVYAKAQQVAEANQELKASNEQLTEFTQELQRSEEELKTQQEELETSNEEMEEKNNMLEQQNLQIRRQSDELERAGKVLEEKAQELSLSSKYKSEFLANMSHELRTPLNSLLILARSLASNEEGNLTPEQVEEARVIHGGGLELLNLINDILDLSKVEAGKLNVVVEDVPLDNIVKRMEQQFAPLVKETGLAFKVKAAQGLPDTISTDTQRVEQILKNLLANSFKFTQKGSITLDLFLPDRTTSLHRPSLEHGSTIAFAVTDTGIGIDESKLNSIFEAFQQEDGSIDRHYGGTGLGLTIARKFARLLGGEIQVASKKGAGSTFTLMLPLSGAQAEAPAAPAPAEKETAPQAAGRRTELKSMPKISVQEFVADDRDVIGDKDRVMLIIEDDKAFARTLMKTARKRGYKCLAAGDGKTGILLASEQQVSAIVLDLKLPDIDGLVVLDQLKHDLRTRHIPVHIITGRDEAEMILPLRKGAVGYLTKPVDVEQIDSAFQKIEAFLKSSLRKVLVVEDDRKSQAAIQNLLRKKDIEITCAGTGHAALERIAEERFDCVILDLLLPDMTGFEWLEEAEAKAGGGNLPPVIIYTAKELTEEENRKLNRHTGSIVIKGAHSSERLLDEVTLFLHSLESTLSKDQQAMIRMQHDPDKVLQDKTVLLVDDDMRNTFALSKILKKHGMTVVIADNGQMALDKLKQDKAIGIVIMDIMMPVMDGYQAMEAIRAQKACKALPIIALTARAMPEEQDKCLKAGANDYLTKPVDVESLLTLMRLWLFKQDEAA